MAPNAHDLESQDSAIEWEHLIVDDDQNEEENDAFEDLIGKEINTFYIQSAELT